MRKRIFDLALGCFYLFTSIVIVYTIDVEALIQPDVSERSGKVYPWWPPAFVVDRIHDYAKNYDPVVW